MNPRLEAIPHLQRAIELDPEFALAHGAAVDGVRQHRPDDAGARIRAARRSTCATASASASGSSSRCRYYRDATQDWDEALELSRSWTATYPREAFAFNSLGQSLLRFGQFEQAVEPLRESIQLDAEVRGAILQSRRVIHGARSIRRSRGGAAGGVRGRGSPRSRIRRMNYLLAFIRGDEPTMARMLEASVGVGQTNAAYGWQAHALAHAGKVTAASEQFHLGVQMARQAGFQEVAGQLTIEDAEAQAIVGQCDNVRSESCLGAAVVPRQLLARARKPGVDPLRRLQRRRPDASRTRQRFPSATLTTLVSIPIAEAAGALRRNDPRRVLALLEPVKPYEHASRASLWPEYLRGQAFLRLKDGQSAAADSGASLDIAARTRRRRSTRWHALASRAPRRWRETPETHGRPTRRSSRPGRARMRGSHRRRSAQRAGEPEVRGPPSSGHQGFPVHTN